MKLVTVTLQKPIQRGEKTIEAVALREPKAGEMRGLSMVELVQLKVEAVAQLLERITNPPLTRPEIDDLTPTDMFLLSTEIANFFLPAGAIEDSPDA